MMELKTHKLKCELWIASNEDSTGANMSLLFVCDPKKNVTCTKGSMCGKECTMTSDILCAKEFDLDD